MLHLFLKQAVRQISNIGRAYDLKQTPTASHISAEINRKFFVFFGKINKLIHCQYLLLCVFLDLFLVFVLLPCWQIKMNITLNISLMLQTVECYENSL